MLAELLTGAEVDFCSEDEVVPIVGRHLRARRTLPGGGRLIKTHEPYCRAYKRERAIYLVRDVRDVALSFHKLRAVEGFDDESFEVFLVRFVQGDIGGLGSWQAHVTSWLEAASDPASDIMVVHYEELVDDTVAKLGEIARFLGVSIDDARLREIVDNNQPDKMRDRPTPYSQERMSVTVGSGTYNGWRTRYSESALACLEPAMRAMRRAGYTTDDGSVVAPSRLAD